MPLDPRGAGASGAHDGHHVTEHVHARSLPSETYAYKEQTSAHWLSLARLLRLPAKEVPMSVVLVTGATGRVGRHVVTRLREAGVEVRALTRDPGISGFTGDLRDPKSLVDALDGVEAVFLVWPFGTAEGAGAVLEVVAQRARRVVYLSSAAVRDHEREIERLVGRSGLEWTILRPHAFAANALRWAELPPQATRDRLLASGWPPDATDATLDAQAALVETPGPTTSAIEDVTGTPARTFRDWARDHAHAFREADKTMRAARIHEYGEASVIRYDEVPRPRPGPGEVLIEVAATSFNPSEVGLRLGLLDGVLPVTLPHTLGWDVSGTVVETGAGVTEFAPGDRVIGLVDGAAAEYTVASANVLARAPETIPLEAAAAVPVAGLTAWQAVFEHARISTGQRVLVNGAGGGIGLFAVQLAKRAGATVIATASPRSRDAVRALGADEVVDYTRDPLPGGMDVVLNLAGITPEAAGELAALARPDGVIVTVATPIDSPRATHFVSHNDPGQLAELVALIDAGRLTVEIAESHPLTGLHDIHRRAESGQIRGKIIILPRGTR
ncbi:zinc-binding dehydrogenase [Nonomuraea cavernae]|uniref:zinc-binding dehydrogenase n=1 Tax=Nonomuraea cavernae TaxID=2045107 RepID=UPI0033CD3B6B